MNSEADRIYAKPLTRIDDFCFDEQVADVFPDMVQRSIPGYQTILNTIQSLTPRFAQQGTNLYDLGCSLGAATLAMRRALSGKDYQLIGIDNSEAMLKRCHTYLQAFRSDVPVTLQCADVKDVTISNASIVIMNFTLQFIAPEHRDAILNKIYQGLRPGGLLLLSQKQQLSDPQLEPLLIDLYHSFKKANGYSELEISQKRTALEKVMQLDTPEQEQQRLQRAGFSHISRWFQCYNFASTLAMKSL